MFYDITNALTVSEKKSKTLVGIVFLIPAKAPT